MTYEEIQGRAKSVLAARGNGDKPRIFVGMGTCGIAAGGKAVLAAIEDEVTKQGAQAEINQVGCMGTCFDEVVVDVALPGRPRVSYAAVTPEKGRELVRDVVVGGNLRPDLAAYVLADEPYEGIQPASSTPFLAKQVRVVLRNCGIIDPESIEAYIAAGGYEGLKNALSMPPEQVIEVVKASKLRGRGGAGFSTGMKWTFARAAKGTLKYVVCNADEGDPGAFMDRSVLEGDPHTVLEGMLIAAYAIGSSEGYIYCRAEYPLAIARLKKAIAQAEEYGLLGKNVMGTDFSLTLHIKEGAGAFVCGEETALMASIEGRRGMPRPRPPFPANSGLWEKPTNINNVETFASVPVILTKGAEWFASIGSERSGGTKVFALTGRVQRSGLAEVPVGTPIRDVVFSAGGGIANNKQFKAAQTGGPSGGCLPPDTLDTPMDYETLTRAGSIMGSGGLVVMDENTCMVDMARYFLSFTQAESCGKCIPCRRGTKQMYDMLENITQGKGKMEDLDTLQRLALMVKEASLCGLGQTAPNPVLTTIRYFRDEYEAHIRDHRCPAGVCKALITYDIDAEKCKACMICKRACPVNAIAGERKVVHTINQDACIKCGTCMEKCPFGAISVK